MRIIILSRGTEVANTIEAHLMDYGHETMAVSGAVWEKLANDLSGACDGCLILDADDEQWRLARMLHERGVPLWNDWKNIPPTKEWPNSRKIAGESNRES